VLVPYSSSHSVTVCPSGLTLAFRVAEVCPTALAAFVSAVARRS
jgi:hypothetical protein